MLRPAPLAGLYKIRSRGPCWKKGVAISYAAPAAVYFDFEAISGTQTRLTQTIVIDLMNPLYKALGDVMGYLTGSRAMWNRHFQEELDNLKAHIGDATLVTQHQR